jgi:hypothetical protein
MSKPSHQSYLLAVFYGEGMWLPHALPFANLPFDSTCKSRPFLISGITDALPQQEG